MCHDANTAMSITMCHDANNVMLIAMCSNSMMQPSTLLQNVNQFVGCNDVHPSVQTYSRPPHSLTTVTTLNKSTNST